MSYNRYPPGDRSAMCLFAGFVVVRIAKKNELINTLSAYVLTIIITICLRFVTPNSHVHYPFWFKPFGYIITPFLYLAGGYLGLLLNKREKPLFKLPFRMTRILWLLFITLVFETLLILSVYLILNLKMGPATFLDDALLLIAMIGMIIGKKWGYFYTMILSVILLIGTVPGIFTSDPVAGTISAIFIALYCATLVFTFKDYRKRFGKKDKKRAPIKEKVHILLNRCIMSL